MAGAYNIYQPRKKLGRLEIVLSLKCATQPAFAHVNASVLAQLVLQSVETSAVEHKESSLRFSSVLFSRYSAGSLNRPLV